MKKISFLIISLLSFTISAQTDSSFGFKAGANYAQFTPDIVIAGITAIDYQGKTGYYIGGFYNFSLSEKFSVQPELLVANQGTQIVNGEISLRDASGDFTVGSIESNLNEFSILLPVMIQFKLTDNLFLEGGPQVAYAFKRTELIKKNPFDLSSEGQKSTASPFVSDFDKLDLGLNIGIGYNLTEKLDLNLRYSLGLLERDNYKTSIFNLGIGFRL
ncbi:porin family protein [Maribacter sp. 2308TA10-17]|uniref:porin family protein n=1 Tax=Maribacter sp. 2308TA10-17 TaxID=3386276 RepID=UPI0039BD1411